MASLSKNIIASRSKLVFEKIDLPEESVEKEGDVITATVRGTTAKEREEFNDSLWPYVEQPDGTLKQIKSNDNAKAKLIVRCLYTEKHELVYSKEEWIMGAEAIGNMAPKSVDRMYDKIQELSGYGKKATKTIAKN